MSERGILGEFDQVNALTEEEQELEIGYFKPIEWKELFFGESTKNEKVDKVLTIRANNYVSGHIFNSMTWPGEGIEGEEQIDLFDYVKNTGKIDQSYNQLS